MSDEHARIVMGAHGDGRGLFSLTWPSALVVVAGIWLLVAPLVIDRVGSRDGVWSDVAIGAALVLSGSVRIVFPVRTVLLGLVNAALGVWLVLAPFALHYQGVSVPARANDLLVGMAVTVLAVVSAINCSFAWQPAEVRRGHRTGWPHAFRCPPASPHR
ncbi:SPW repeat domain-containing protein [Pseudonocardia acidicola]|uniref:SPW repeat-containing integral membrane domain-containing protein n=1 Tax=Pseudonocardia acidicola TaxID=2724939 RepID=A0ABX1SB04_9PSEU|nr:SPW repeat protein [Pseudonocardia acidicola]NMH97546.1 hypothetical protein [Pseudonocardia acidicola]